MFKTDIILTAKNRQKLVKLRNYIYAVTIPIVFLFRVIISAFKVINWYPDDSIAIVGIIIIIAALLFGVFLHIYSRRKRTIGKIELNQDNISTFINDQNNTYPLSKIQNLTISQDLLEGNSSLNASISFYDNWLSFQFEGKPFEFQFSLSSSYARNELGKVITNWRDLGIISAMPNL